MGDAATKNTTRLIALDYLRGLAALGIVFYHYTSWSFKPYDSSTVMGRIGIYGVSVFYVLSGITLYHVYNRFEGKQSVVAFFTKRVFRIFPLLWLSILLNIFWIGGSYSAKILWLNFSGLFGFLSPSSYISVGGWSIGNELFFYSIFPFVIYAGQKRKWIIGTFFILTAILAIYFSFFELDSAKKLEEQWSTYINPLNQLVFFFGGVYAAKLYGMAKNTSVGPVLLILSALVFIVYPSYGDLISLVSNWDRLVFSLVTFLFTVSMLFFRFSGKGFFQQLFSKLGHVSYSIYLLHGVIFWGLDKYVNRVEYPMLFLVFCFCTTIVVSVVSYELIEKRGINMGKSLLKKMYS